MKQTVVAIVGTMLLSVGVGGARAEEAPRVQISRESGEAVLTVQSGALRVVQQIGRERFDLKLTEGSDEVRLLANIAGQVTIWRGRRTQTFDVKASTARTRAAVEALLAGSVAVRSFDRLIDSAPPQPAMGWVPLRSAQSMMRTLQGDDRALRAKVASLSERGVRVVRARITADCGAEYAAHVEELFSELESCLDTWNPFQTAWCAYSFDAQVVMAFLEYGDCLL